MNQSQEKLTEEVCYKANAYIHGFVRTCRVKLHTTLPLCVPRKELNCGQEFLLGLYNTE